MIAEYTADLGCKSPETREKERYTLLMSLSELTEYLNEKRKQ